jgi:3-hydroxyisobutyrate dehydrogenase/2-hydroxy-3-oxopropionate reductase
MASVGVVGLGAMGSRIAERLLRHGHEIVVWNRDAAKAAELVEGGATLAASPAEVRRMTEAVIVMVAHPEALRAVTEGSDGNAAGSSGEATLIQMSTVDPEAIRRLESILPNGTPLLDAPVLGSLTEVEAGELKIFASGPEELVERHRPLLSTLGQVFHVGPLGAGTAAKLVANSTLLGVLGVLGEALALAARLGLPQDEAFDVLATTPLAAQAERRRPALAGGGDQPVRFALSLARKDAELIARAGRAVGAELRVAEAVRSWLEAAEARGLGDEAYSAVLAYVART